MNVNFDKEKLLYAGTKAVMFAWLCFKHFWLAVWWLFRFEIWIFYYWCFARWLFGLRLKFPGYYDIWFKNKPKEYMYPQTKRIRQEVINRQRKKNLQRKASRRKLLRTTLPMKFVSLRLITTW